MWHLRHVEKVLLAFNVVMLAQIASVVLLVYGIIGLINSLKGDLC